MIKSILPRPAFPKRYIYNPNLDPAEEKEFRRWTRSELIAHMLVYHRDSTETATKLAEAEAKVLNLQTLLAQRREQDLRRNQEEAREQTAANDTTTALDVLIRIAAGRQQYIEQLQRQLADKVKP